MSRIMDSTELFLFEPRLLDHLGTGFITTTGGVRITGINVTFADMLGYQPEDLIGHYIEEYTHLDDITVEKHVVQRALGSSLEEFRYEKRFIHKNGHPVPVRVTVTILEHELEDGTKFLGLVKKLDEKERAKRSLHAVRSVLNDSEYGVAFFDVDGRLTYVNRAFLLFWGYKKEEDVLGKPAMDFWKTGEEAENAVQSMRTGKQLNTTLFAKKTNETFAPIHVRVWPVRDMQSSAFAICALFDTTSVSR